MKTINPVIAILAFSLIATIFPFTSDAASADNLLPIEISGKWGYIDLEGHLIVDPQFTQASGFYGREMAEVMLDGMWGLIDAKGKVTIELKFEAINFCSKGQLYPAKMNGRWGFINSKGSFIIQPQYDWVTCFYWGANDSLASVNVRGKWGLIDDKENMILKPTFEDFSGPVYGLSAVQINGKWGYADLLGQIVIQPIFDRAYTFDDHGYATVRLNEKWGLIDKSGNFIIKPTFDDALYFFDQGLAKVTVQGKEGFIDIQGHFVIEPQFEQAGGFYKSSLAYAKINGKYGFIDKTGHFVIKPSFDETSGFSNGLAAVKVNGKWGYINTKGDVVISPKYVQAWAFGSSGLANVMPNNVFGYINTSGRVVTMPMRGCGTTIVMNGNNQVIWPADGQKYVDCIRTANAVDNLDAATIRSNSNTTAKGDASSLVKVVEGRAPDRSTDAEKQAYTKRQIETIKALVANGVDPNGNNPKQPILSTAISRNPELAITLINLGANVNAVGQNSVLIEALQLKRPDIVIAMLDHRANPNKPGNGGITPLGYIVTYKSHGPMTACGRSAYGDEHCEKIEAEQYDRTMWAKVLLDHGADPNKPSPDVAPLMMTSVGDDEVIKLIVSRGGKVIPPAKTVNIYGHQMQIGPVTWTIYNDRVDLFQAALNQSNGKLDASEKYAIVIAVMRSKPDMVRALLDHGADPNTPDDEYGALLNMAANKGNVEVARLLIAKGAKVNAMTPILLPSIKDDIEFSALDAHITPLIFATINDNAPMVKLLLDNGADVNKSTIKGKTALSLTHNPEIIQLLKAKGAKN